MHFRLVQSSNKGLLRVFVLKQTLGKDCKFEFEKHIRVIDFMS